MKWKPGCSCAAALKVCDAHEVDEREERISYPEQWAWVQWRPARSAAPVGHPDGWGVHIGKPWDLIREQADGAELYLLPVSDCLWSVWLDIALSCETFKPWLTDCLRTRREEQRVLERTCFVQRYGSATGEFQSFMAAAMPKQKDFFDEQPRNVAGEGG